MTVPPDIPVATRSLAGFGRTRHSVASVIRPQRRAQLLSALATAPEGALLARGFGRSYGDAAQVEGGTVFDMTRLDRVLDFDAASGVLVCEAGVRLVEIDRLFVPRGFALPVVPGTGTVSVGGAIAADIHGKNHDRVGSFGDHVDWLDLLTPDAILRRVDTQSDPELFAATIGGMGLTGIVLQAAIRLQPVPSAYVSCRRRRITDLDSMLTALAGHRPGATYCVAWIDALARGGALGRGILEIGEPAPADALPARPPMPPRPGPRVPFEMPSWVPLKLAARAFNMARLSRAPAGGQERLMHRDAFFYPLDALRDWNRLYGRRGFCQFQCVVPDDQAATGLRRILETVSRSRPGALLGVLKTMGSAGRGHLSFARAGHTLALDIPWRSQSRDLLAQLERIALDCGGRIYLAKDSALSAEGFAAMYPDLPRLQEVLARIDPQARFQSDLARRLRIRGFAQ